jgi:hypothetical protein
MQLPSYKRMLREQQILKQQKILLKQQQRQQEQLLLQQQQQQQQLELELQHQQQQVQHTQTAEGEPLPPLDPQRQSSSEFRRGSVDLRQLSLEDRQSSFEQDSATSASPPPSLTHENLPQDRARSHTHQHSHQFHHNQVKKDQFQYVPFSVFLKHVCENPLLYCAFSYKCHGESFNHATSKVFSLVIENTNKDIAENRIKQQNNNSNVMLNTVAAKIEIVRNSVLYLVRLPVSALCVCFVYVHVLVCSHVP